MICVALVVVVIANQRSTSRKSSLAGWTPPESIATNCSRDSTAAFNRWFAGLPNHTTVLLGHKACYRLDRTLAVTRKAGLTIDGNGATFRRITPTPANLLAPKANAHLLFTFDTHLIIKDLHVIGLNTHSDLNAAVGVGRQDFETQKFGSIYGNKAFEAGVALYSDDHATVDHVTTDGTFGDGFTVGTENAPVPSSHVMIENCTVDRNGRQGVAVVNAHHVTVYNVEVLHSHAVGLDIEANGARSHVSDVEVSHSYFNSRIINVSLGGSQGESNVYFHDNVIRGQDHGFAWFAVHNGQRGSIRNIRVIHNRAEYLADKGSPIDVTSYNTSDVAIEGNYSVVRAGLTGVTVGRSILSPLRIVDNQFIGSGRVATRTPAGATVCGNQIAVSGAFDQPVPCTN